METVPDQREAEAPRSGTGPKERILALRVRLGETLFRQAPQEPRRLGQGEYALVVAALLALAVFAELLRPGLSTSLDSLWAEDGQIFLQGAASQGFWEAITSVYSNYLVVVPRLIAEAADLLPLRDAPAGVSILSAVMIALSGLVVWYASAAHIRNPFLRGSLAAVTVLAPVAGLESVDSASYVSWYMLVATFWVLLWRPRTTVGAAFAALFVLATALSNPGVWFFIPLAALRALAIRDRRDLIIVSSFAIGSAIQMPVLALSNEPTVDPVWTSDIWTVYVQRVVDGAAFGERLGGAAWAHLGWPFLIALLACGVAGLVLGLKQSSSAARYFAVIALPTSLVMFVVAIYQRAVATQMIWPDGTHFGNGGRYAIVPALLLISAALVLLDSSLRKRPRHGWPQWIGTGAVALLLLGVVTSFYVRDTAARGTPSWEDALNSAASTCTAEHPATVVVPTSPPGFGVTLPCDQVVTHADQRSHSGASE